MRHLLTVLFSLATMPAFAQNLSADANEIPPPYLGDSVLVLFLFVAIFVAAAWSLAVFMQMSPRRFARGRLFRK